MLHNVSGVTIPINFRLILEIEDGEFAVVFSCGFVVCLCGLDLILEISEMY